MAALSRFVSAGGKKGHPYFQCLRRNSRFAWTDECESTFLKLKEYLATPPVLCKSRAGVPLRLYFAVTEWAISSVVVQEQDQVQSFTVVVMTNLPIQKVLQKPDVVGRMVRWAVEQSEFDIQYEPRGSIKGQVNADFGAELLPGGDLQEALRFVFIASNNQAEYEVLIAGMLLANEMGAQSLLAKSDSQLVTGQVTGEYQAKDPHMAAYLRPVPTGEKADEVPDRRHRVLLQVDRGKTSGTDHYAEGTTLCLEEHCVSFWGVEASDFR
ncbi:uncharacterized protein [Phaseolus vulgaris]|uniref:uncharacterized protein n=1 Tax=Phaseolus vulgaris TaxID=3885 RepID=UPI0035CCA204